MSLDALIIDLARLRHDPYKFVMWAFPWGEEGELKDFKGPEPWQEELLKSVRDKLVNPYEAVQMSRTSGHGIGKSAMAAWLILWGISTAECLGVVTANTEKQLKTKTWATLSRWHRLFIGRDLFKMTATSIYRADPGYEREWRIDMVPWSEKNMEAFAGLHNKGKRVLQVFDEGSAIPDAIYETASGALTDTETEILQFIFGNPTKNTGFFRETFAGGRFAHRWDSAAIDSRTVSIANHKQIQEWIEDYGEDSDYVRIRVRGVFPRAGDVQFISSESVSEAATRSVDVYAFEPFVMGVDVARFGDAASVIYLRQGRDARTHEPIQFRGLDTMTLSEQVAKLAQQFKIDAVFVDGGGVGGGVVDRLRQLRVPVWDVQFGAKSDKAVEGELYSNKRSEMWGSLRKWLTTGAIPSSDELREQLIGPSYGLNARDEIQLEKKEDMKKRGLASPDIADALALTFAYTVVASSDRSVHLPAESVWDYDPFEMKAMAA